MTMDNREKIRALTSDLNRAVNMLATASASFANVRTMALALKKQAQKIATAARAAQVASCQHDFKETSRRSNGAIVTIAVECAKCAVRRKLLDHVNRE